MDVFHLDVFVDSPEGTDGHSAAEFVKRRLMQSCNNIHEASVVLALYDDKEPATLLRTVVEGSPTEELKKTLDEL